MTKDIQIAFGVDVDRLAFEAMAEAAVIDAFMTRDIGNQIMVPFHAVRRKVGKPAQVARWRVTDG